MKNKEECLKALCRIQCGAKANEDCKACECFDDKINPWKCVENTKESILIREVIQEHFELLNGIERIIGKAKELSDSNDELKGLYFITSYKLEDLKEDMWVYDGIEKLICQIGLISKNAIHRKYVDDTISDSPFEENRFYPPQMANVINIKKENKENNESNN